MERFDCLDPSLEVMGNHFLRASAGTGKTFAIEHIYLKLVKEGLKTEEILVVTFTQKATRDLIERIGAHFPCLDGAEIYTIHGFCLRALEEKTTFDIDEGDPSRAITDYFRTKVAPPKFSKEAIQALFKRYNHDFKRILEAIKGTLGNASPDEDTLHLIASEIKVPTPHDLLTEMQKALEDPAFLKRMRGRYRAVIIDEFQDTDPIQWEIFSTLFLNQVEAFYLVGDEKQSIYGFRNADLNVYFKAREALGREQYLDTNFRSEPQLVEALNRFFARLEFSPVKAREGILNTAFKDGLGPLVLMGLSGKKGRSRSFPTKEMEEKYLFPFLAKEILKGEFPFGSWAILVRDRFQLERLRRYLSMKGIPTAASGGGRLSEAQAYLFLEKALQATKAPFDRRLCKKVFADPLMGWSIHEVEACKESFFALSEVYREEGFEGWIHAFLNWNLEGETILEKLSKDLDVYSDAMQCIEYRFDIDDQTERKAIQDVEAVQIMTIHKSKGLEFEMVVALGVGTRTTHPDDQEEKLRQLYVALTRAKKRVYVPYFQEIGKKRELDGLSSPMELYGDCSEFPLIDLEGIDLRISGETEEALCEFQAFEEPHFEAREIFSFTALSNPTHHTYVLPEGELPGGAETGTEMHALFEKVIAEGLYTPWNEELIRDKIRRGALTAWEETVYQMVKRAFEIPLDGFSLREVPPCQMYPEVEFIYPQGSHFLKGFMDLVFEKEGKLYLLDWKTNVLERYDEAGLQEGMKEGDYFLQAALYKEALHRHLEGSDLEFGGIYYCFLRGGAIYDVC